jgi:uncharacterized membrane protein YphA (DoxX/SURF4 family)
MILIGVLEVAGGVALLVPYPVIPAAAGLFMIMIGATYSHLELAGEPLYTRIPSLATGLVMVGIILLRWSIARRVYLDPNRPLAEWPY